MNTAIEKAKFHHMKEGTAEDWQIIMREARDFSSGLADRMLTHLKLLDGDSGGFPIDRLTHCLQTATLAHKDGRDQEYVVCALLHDIGDTLGPFNHADVAAVLLEPFVTEQNHWMIKHHAIFQGYYFFHHIGLDRNMHEQFKDHPHYDYTKEFIEKYDAPAFDPEAESYSLDFFEPMLRRVLASPRQSVYKTAMEG
ncbi:MAG: HD domain-containing protein [Congregibacter sp.]